MSFDFFPIFKDLIIRGGENIYPTEVEQFLYKHPKVQDVQVECQIACTAGAWVLYGAWCWERGRCEEPQHRAPCITQTPATQKYHGVGVSSTFLAVMRWFISEFVAGIQSPPICPPRQGQRLNERRIQMLWKGTGARGRGVVSRHEFLSGLKAYATPENCETTVFLSLGNI